MATKQTGAKIRERIGQTAWFSYKDEIYEGAITALHYRYGETGAEHDHEGDAAWEVERKTNDDIIKYRVDFYSCFASRAEAGKQKDIAALAKPTRRQFQHRDELYATEDFKIVADFDSHHHPAYAQARKLRFLLPPLETDGKKYEWTKQQILNQTRRIAAEGEEAIEEASQPKEIWGASIQPTNGDFAGALRETASALFRLAACVESNQETFTPVLGNA